jgi:signal transduction histidine kinase
VNLVEFVETMLRQVGRMQELIDQVLDTSQLHAGAFRLELADVDLRDLLQQAVDLLGTEARERVQVSCEASTSTQGQWDGPRLRQVLGNVLSNAIKYAPTGDIQVVVDDAPEDCVMLTVRDHGIGLSPDDQQQLFSRFYRSAEAVRRKIEGTGLGLVIVRAIVAAHGGTFTLESEGPNQGTTATILLPRHPVPASQ